jgi:hypothetical protein
VTLARVALLLALCAGGCASVDRPGTSPPPAATGGDTAHADLERELSLYSD